MIERGISTPAFFLSLVMFAICILAFIGTGKLSGETTTALSNETELDNIVSTAFASTETVHPEGSDQ